MKLVYEPIKKIKRYIELAALITLVLIYGWATYQRNFVWKDDISLWSDVVKKSPGNFRGYYGLGKTYAEINRYDLAIQHYKAILQHKAVYRSELKFFSDIHNSLGIAYIKIGSIKEGIEEFKNAIKIDPNYVRAYYNLGITYMNKGFIDEGIEELKTAIKIDPYYLDAHYYLGIAYQRKNLIDKAISQYETVLRLKPDLVHVINDLGVLYFSKGQVEKAIEKFKQAIKIMPDYPEAHNNLGIAYSKKGLNEPAERELLKGYELHNR